MLTTGWEWLLEWLLEWLEPRPRCRRLELVLGQAVGEGPPTCHIQAHTSAGAVGQVRSGEGQTGQWQAGMATRAHQEGGHQPGQQPTGGGGYTLVLKVWTGGN